MDCQAIQKLIPEYLDEGLDPKKRQLVENHLGACPLCQKELKLYKKSWEMLGSWNDIEPAPGYMSRFWGRMAEGSSWHEEFIEGLKNIFEPRKLVPVLAAVCIILAGLFSWNNYARLHNSDGVLASLSEDEEELVENMELAQQFEVIESIDMLEDLEILENLDSLTSEKG